MGIGEPSLSLAEMVCYVEERDCYTAGYVYKIPLRKGGGELGASPLPFSSLDNAPKGDYLIVSWIYDVKDKNDDVDYIV
ncbi:hypothetical protein EON65_50920 [archaeon]|nr:MAG: hypothetical protein EON65_50920 [archaeon]